ncbi:MAG: cation transporter [Chloroflexia bacterium]|nr:cation transporter [Chloroflexia bacterium]MDQ3410921.1 cation diffusion facilitator family transporter [Chloroflexota bacterium]
MPRASRATQSERSASATPGGAGGGALDDQHDHPHDHADADHAHPHGEPDHAHAHGGDRHEHGQADADPAHAHDHGPHEHSHGHGHDHGSGVLGWIKGTFAHSHDMHEKVDDVMETHERGFWATKWALVSLAITTAIQIVIVYYSGSTALFADTVHNLGDGANSIPLLIAFALQRRVRSRQFSYGFGRVEDVAGVVVLLTIAISAAVAGWESVRKLLDPEPITHLPWVTLAALIGFVGNEIVAILQIRTGRQIGSAALIADGQHARIDGFTSLAVLGAVVGVLIGVPILDPIIGLLITITILIILKGNSGAVFRRLLDGIEPEILAEIEHAPLHAAGVRAVQDAKARWVGHKVRAELDVGVDPNLTIAESEAIADDILRALADHVPSFGGATVRLRPATAPNRSDITSPAASVVMT